MIFLVIEAISVEVQLNINRHKKRYSIEKKMILSLKISHSRYRSFINLVQSTV